MCNCGNKRNHITQQQPNKIVRQTKINQAMQPMSFIEKRSPVMFEYTGNTALSVIGSITRKYYRFHYPGNKLLIEASDAAAMMAIPVLKRVE
ncbi:MAG: hypothetical protein JST21_16070 [Bacteroidetes bacterium]|nr:hypothetical protein [Bacteroidota bacterium]